MIALIINTIILKLETKRSFVPKKKKNKNIFCNKKKKKDLRGFNWCEKQCLIRGIVNWAFNIAQFYSDIALLPSKIAYSHTTQ